MIVLSPVEIRVLGSLMEKEVATPEAYPLTLNSLRNACNQKTSRDPVMSLDEMQVVHAVARLRDHGIVSERSEPGNRSPKYIHYFENLVPCSPAERAALCVLMLRGEQTTGEIRGRSGRLHEFKDPAEVETVLMGLMTREAPLVEKLPRQPGTKESRYRHLLCGPSAVVAVAPSALSAPDQPALTSVPTPEDRLVVVERQMASLRQEVESVKSRLVQLIEGLRSSDEKAGNEN
jgi:uncharacterized protein YceH (UPF0502 family)